MFLLVIILVGGIITIGTQRTSDIKDNHLTIPVVKGDIKETFTPKEPITIGGTSQQKDVSVVNSGNTDFFIRVLIFPEIMTDTESILTSNIGQEVIVNLSKEWIDGKDGYYYYTKALKPGQTTSSVFTQVRLSDQLDDNYKGAHFSMQIKVETVSNSNYSYRSSWWNEPIDVAPKDGEKKIIDDFLNQLVTK